MTVHLFAWREQSGGGLQGYKGAFESVELAEQALVKMNPPTYNATYAQSVSVNELGGLYCVRDYRRNRCWFDEQNIPHIDGSGKGVWVVIGDKSNPMTLIPGQQVEELVR